MSTVALSITEPVYPAIGPFHPSEKYPEYPFPIATCLSSSNNGVYAAVRNTFELLGLDRSHQGSANWNPLRDIIPHGAAVVIKPNWVHHLLAGDAHPEEILITHPAVIRAVLDYVFLACGPTGKVTLGDAPIQGADFTRILEMSQVQSIVNLYRQYHNFNIEVADFRGTVATVTASGQVIQHKQERADPRGYREVDLSENSFYREIDQHWQRFRVADYDPVTLQQNHHEGTHKYLISGSVLEADVIVNIPKLKSHKACGVTCSLKNLVGINGDKAYLPHFRTGSPAENGDDYPYTSLLSRARTEVRSRLVLAKNEQVWRVVRWLGKHTLSLAERLNSRQTVGGVTPYTIYSGCWSGNDTAWRMVLDLNVLLFFANREGTLEKYRQRQYISIVDAIIAGEGHGPLAPRRRPVGAILTSQSPVATDLVASHCMGFDWEKISLLRNAYWKLGVSFPEAGNSPIIVSTDAGQIPFDTLDINWNFLAPDGWIGHIEREGSGGHNA